MDIEPPVNILLVDDRQENLVALEALLGPLGHALVLAHSGTEALKHLLKQDFAVILLDVQMPGIDGFETAELIRGRTRSQDTPIIFVTAVNTSDTHVFRGYALGAVDYITKPIVPEVLLSKVSVFVELWIKTEKIRRHSEELEQRVAERTANLAAANIALRHEIAERERAEQERAHMLLREQQARAEAEAAVGLRDQFLSVASHELKTPLTTLFGYVQLLTRRFDKTPETDPQHRALLQVVLEQSIRLNRLIEGLLDISRIQSGQLQISRYPVDVCKVVERVVTELQPSLEHHEVVAQLDDAACTVNGDELRLEQVLHNLIQNAIKYSPQGGTVRVALQRRGEQGVISISDQGIGIPQESLPRLFDRFYRAENADSRNISGMGVGLYVVREIIDMHEGLIEVESEEGQGSTFRIILPCVTVEEENEVEATAQ